MQCDNRRPHSGSSSRSPSHFRIPEKSLLALLSLFHDSLENGHTRFAIDSSLNYFHHFDCILQFVQQVFENMAYRGVSECRMNRHTDVVIHQGDSWLRNLFSTNLGFSWKGCLRVAQRDVHFPGFDSIRGIRNARIEMRVIFQYPIIPRF